MNTLWINQWPNKTFFTILILPLSMANWAIEGAKYRLHKLAELKVNPQNGPLWNQCFRKWEHFPVAFIDCLNFLVQVAQICKLIKIRVLFKNEALTNIAI